jgi:DNA-binding NarL/FixJ family response regulator
LSARESEILQLIVDGNSNREIASQLDLSANTVATHRVNIMKVLRIHKTADLVVYAIRKGLASIL